MALCHSRCAMYGLDLSRYGSIRMLSLSTDGLDSASVCLSYSHEFQTNYG